MMSDDLRSIREELNYLQRQMTILGMRLDSLEKQRSESQPSRRDTDLSVEATPPPIPQEVLAAAESRPAFIVSTPAILESPAPRMPILREAGPSPFTWLEDRLNNWSRRIREAVEKAGWEMFLGTYVLPRIGILVLTVGVVLGLSLAMQHGAPVIRVVLGYAVCGALLILAWRLERKYPAYARILYSGGFALSYFVTFATHYVPQARIIQRQGPTLALLAAVVAVWAVAAQVRRSRTIAVLVTFLGHFTIGLAIITAEHLTDYAVLSIILLSAGSAFFLLRNRWYYVAALGIAGAYTNQAICMYYSTRHRPMDFWLCMAVLSVYLAIFSLAELFAREDLRRKTTPTWFRSTFVTANTAAFFTLGTILVSHFDFTRHHHDVYRFIYGGYLLLVALGYLRLRQADPLYNVYMTKAVLVVTLGLAVRYSGNALTGWLAVESVALLVSARRSGLVVTRLLAFGAALTAFVQGIHVATNMAPVGYHDETYLQQLMGGGLSVLGLLVCSQLYQRTDWSIRSPRTAPFRPESCELLWQLDLIAEPPRPGMTKPVEGLLFPYVYALMGLVLFTLFGYKLMQTGHHLLVAGAAALGMTVAAAALASKPYGLVSVALVFLALATGTLEIALEETATARIGVLSLLALAATAFGCEKRWVGQRAGLSFHQSDPRPYFLYGTTAWLLGWLLCRELQPPETYAVLGLAGAAAVTGALVLLLHPKAMALISTGLMVWAGLRWFPGGPHSSLIQWYVVGWVVVALSLGGDRFFAGLCNRLTLKWPGQALLIVAWGVVLRYTCHCVPKEWGYFGSGMVSFGFLSYGLGFRSRTAGVIAVLTAGGASCLLVQSSYYMSMDMGPLVGGYVVLALFWMTCERLMTIANRRMNLQAPDAAGYAMVVPPVALLVVLLERVPALGDYYLTISWTVLALGCYAVSLAFRQRFYRYAGLGVFVLAVFRVFAVDIRNLEGPYKIAAAVFLGAILLGVGYGYFRAMALFRPKAGTQPQSETVQDNHAGEAARKGPIT